MAVNSRAKPDILAHLLKYDSVHGKFQAEVAVDGKDLVVNGRRIVVTNVSSPLTDLPWKDLGVDIVIESTGVFTDAKGDPEKGKAGANAHTIGGGANNVVR